MSIYRDAEYGNVIHAEFPGPEKNVLDNRLAHDALGELSHRRYHDADRLVLSWACGFAVAVLLMAFMGWIA
jgi:hypothetical protein